MKKSSKKKIAQKKEMHAWRLCPVGEHWVRTHPLTIPPSRKSPIGKLTTRKGHCACNPTGKDQLYPDEIQEMAEKNFSKVKDKPCPIDLGFDAGSEYDDLIAGWTKYWNEVLQPQVSLEPNIVKALIASESGFREEMLANKNNLNSARGLMQILNSTRKTLVMKKASLRIIL